MDKKLIDLMECHNSEIIVFVVISNIIFTVPILSWHKIVLPLINVILLNCFLPFIFIMSFNCFVLISNSTICESSI